MQKTKLLTLCSLALISLAGCGGTTDNPSDGIGNNDLVYDENNNIVYDGVELTMWSVTTGDDATTQDNIIKEFNTLYEGMIHVTVDHRSRYDLEQLLNSTMQFDQENAPDLLFNHGARVDEYNDRNWLLPIEDYYELGNVPLDKEDFASSLIASTTLDGKMYATPIDVHSATVTMRVDILEKNGLKIPSNYQELVDVCEEAIALASEGKLYIRGENSDGYTAEEWRLASTGTDYVPFPISYGDMWVHEFAGYTAAVQNGGTIVDEEGNPAWNTQETANGLQVLRDWIFPENNTSATNKEALSLDYGSDYDVGIGPFNSGNCIFKLDGPWIYAQDITNFDRMLSKDGGSANITTRSMSSLFAKDSTKEYASKIKGEGHAVMLMSTVESTTERCAAAVFADYLAYYSGIEWAKRGHIPAASSVLNSDEYKSDPAYESYIKYWGVPEDYVVYGPTISYTYVDQYFKAALQRSITKDFLNESCKDILQKQYEDCMAYIELYA